MSRSASKDDHGTPEPELGSRLEIRGNVAQSSKIIREITQEHPDQMRSRLRREEFSHTVQTWRDAGAYILAGLVIIVALIIAAISLFTPSSVEQQRWADDNHFVDHPPRGLPCGQRHEMTFRRLPPCRSQL